MDTIDKILLVDPEVYYTRFTVNTFTRSQKVGFAELFPPLAPLCSCGCGVELKGRQTRWSKTSCAWLPSKIFDTIQGNLQTVYAIIVRRDGAKCRKCEKTEEELIRDLGGKVFTRYNRMLAVDHILAVCNGGGGCWLDNYQLLCDACHNIKTQEDRRLARERKKLCNKS